MANVLFKRGNTATINGTAVTDGQLLYNTTTGQHYIDIGSTRKEVGKPVVNTTAEVSAITADNIPCGTKPVKELIQSLTANGKSYQADYQDTKYGFTVDGVFYPFGSGAELLWTNSAPTTAFKAQTVALDLSAYVGVGIIAKTQATIDDLSRTVCIGKIGNTKYNTLVSTMNIIEVVGRPFKASASGVVFSNAYYGSLVANNVYTIPLYIFGLKNMLGFEDYIN